jgi:hypothetical protein
MVIRDAGPWTPTVHALLRHLEDPGFAGAPCLVGSGLDCEGREVPEASLPINSNSSAATRGRSQLLGRRRAENPYPSAKD